MEQTENKVIKNNKVSKNYRHNAREVAFKMIFQMDVGKNPMEMALLTMDEALEEHFIREKDCDYIKDVTSGVFKEREKIDDFISGYSKGWEINRIHNAERNILRLALYEIFFMEQIPFEVSVNEGVELAKVYGADDGYAFVNGILDKAKS